MRRDDQERRALFSERGLLSGHRSETANEDTMRRLGASTQEIERANRLSELQCRDSLVIYCELHGIQTLTPLRFDAKED